MTERRALIRDGADGRIKEMPAGDTLVAGSILSSTVSTQQDDYNPSGLAGAAHIRWDGTANTKWTGLLAGYDGQEIVLHNVDAALILRLDHESASSSAANRFSLPDAQFLLIGPGDKARLWYNGASSRWEWINGIWRSGGPHAVVPGAAASYISNALTGSVQTTGGFAANRLDMLPFIPARDLAINELAIEVTTGVASSLAYLAIYDDVAGVPTNLIIASPSTLDCATTGFKTSAVAETWLQKGKVYWLAVFSSSTQTLRALAIAGAVPVSAIAAGGGGYNMLRRATYTFGAPPATAPATTLTTSNGAVAYMRLKLA